MPYFRLLAMLAVAVCATTSVAQQCTYTLRMEDSGGDGWDGSYVTICVNSPLGGPGCVDHTLAAGAVEDVTFTGSLGQTVVLYFTAVGSNPNEISVELLAMNEDVFYSNEGPLYPGVFHAYTVNAVCNTPPLSISDCDGSADLFANGQTISLIPSPTSDIVDLDASNSGCLAGEHVGAWFRVRVDFQYGNLGIEITPTSPTANLDFALWGPLPGGSPCPMSGPPIRCSAALNGGPTGMGPTAVDLSEDTSGDGWVAEHLVFPNTTYMLYVDSPDSSGTGFSVRATVELGTGVEANEVVRTPAWRCWPTPAVGALEISGPAPAHAFATDLQGRTIWSGVLPAQGTLDVSTWSAGSYMVHVDDECVRVLVGE